VNRRSVFIREQASVRSCGATTGGEANFRTGIKPVRADKLQDMRGNRVLCHAKLEQWDGTRRRYSLQFFGGQGRAAVGVFHAPTQNVPMHLARSAATLRRCGTGPAGLFSPAMLGASDGNNLSMSSMKCRAARGSKR
jgi:hypothetical protein